MIGVFVRWIKQHRERDGYIFTLYRMLFTIQFRGNVNYYLFKLFNPKIIDELLSESEFLAIDADISRIESQAKEMQMIVDEADARLYRNPNHISLAEVQAACRMQCEIDEMRDFVRQYKKEKHNLLIDRLARYW